MDQHRGPRRHPGRRTLVVVPMIQRHPGRLQRRQRTFEGLSVRPGRFFRDPVESCVIPLTGRTTAPVA